eukprot:1620182-Prymnesium_polylepis.1
MHLQRRHYRTRSRRPPVERRRCAPDAVQRAMQRLPRPRLQHHRAAGRAGQGTDVDAVFSSLTDCLCDAGSSFSQLLSGTEPSASQIEGICSYPSCQTMLSTISAAEGGGSVTCGSGGGGGGGGGDGGDNPCFSRDATACRPAREA